MQGSVVITLIGRDRKGLVESVASVVTEHGGNWLESRMCRLGGEFAGIVRIQVPKKREQGLAESLEGLRANGLTVVVRPDEAPPCVHGKGLAVVELVGHDRPGIVHQISATFAAHGCNVEELETECVSAPMSGEMLFKAMARLQIPESCVVSELRNELEKVAADLVVDISFVESVVPFAKS